MIVRDAVAAALAVYDAAVIWVEVLAGAAAMILCAAAALIAPTARAVRHRVTRPSWARGPRGCCAHRQPCVRHHYPHAERAVLTHALH
ncbi:hypothetical protein AB0I54_39155 [Streptomyces sp. NPDC050625]|uniref:hypothetical protein n=1 Tax=Streptomyces sp. NPDC050625 TaxID=3154629 RepID=UPI003416F3C1